jgi:hypothetical protein
VVSSDIRSIRLNSECGASTSQTLTADDPRYRKLFDVAAEAIQTGGRIEGDLTPAMNAMRDQSPVMKGPYIS